MIKQIAVKNFRNLKNELFDLKGHCSIIKGRNGLGKSNLLNAINWVLTDTLLTDNYGKGENDLESIVPNTFEKGQDTEVTLVMDSGIELTKLYKSSFKRGTDKVNGHTTAFQINGVVKTKAEFMDAIEQEFHFEEAFKKLKISEPRLFTDPLYAFQKLDYKELRKLLVSMGCSITNEEIYKMGFQDMRNYESKYQGKFENMRKDLNKTKEKLTVDYKAKEAVKDEYANVEPFNEELYNRLSVQRNELVIKKNSLRSGNSEEVLRLQSEIKNKEFEVKSQIDKAVAEKQNEIRLLEVEKTHLMQDANFANEKASSEIKFDIASIERDADSLKHQINISVLKIKTLEKDKVGYQERAKSLEKDKSRIAEELVEIEAESFPGYVTCPTCGEIFAPNPEDLTNFEKSKQTRITNARFRIEAINQEVKALKDKFMGAKAEVDNEEYLLEEAQASFEELNAKLQSRRTDLATLPTYKADTTEIDNKIDLALQKQRSIKEGYSTDFDTINQLKANLKALEDSNEEVLSAQRDEIDVEIQNLTTSIEELVNIRKANENKANADKQFDLVKKEMNDNDSLLARCNEFIHTMISRINDKARELTGLDFVMLEENLGNENLTETCYVRVNGVPFKDVNTALKVEVGCQFIDICKRVANKEFEVPVNDLPILADRLEGIDHEDKISTIATSQIICTRVATNDSIVIE